MSDTLLDIDGLSLEFPTARGIAKVLDSVSLRLRSGEIVGVVGESGSGKSVLAMAATGLLPRDSYRVTAGKVFAFGKDLLTLRRGELERLRGARIGMVFQEPMNALNPTMRIGAQLEAVVRRHRASGRRAARHEVLELLASMSFADPATVAASYPHELSGGMRQRVLVAMAFTCRPRILIADEPTTALDVTVQAQILDLIATQARQSGAGVLLITHDMAVVSQLCDRVYVMYAGSMVESGATREVLGAPVHPYTRALLDAMPANHAPKSALPAIGGTVPSLLAPPAGCRFVTRCGQAHQRCSERPMMLAARSQGSAHLVACWSVRSEGERR